MVFIVSFCGKWNEIGLLKNEKGLLIATRALNQLVLCWGRLLAIFLQYAFNFGNYILFLALFFDAADNYIYSVPSQHAYFCYVTT
jgi:hypothetical protein